MQNMLDDPDDLRILEGVLDLARAFRLQTVIEGVESNAHIETLLRFSCEFLPGYAISKPMPAAKFFDWLATLKLYLLNKKKG